MISPLERLNTLSRGEAEARFLSCCGSPKWARRMTEERPFRDGEEFQEAADRVWRALPEREWREAFAAHPRIGASAPDSAAGTGPADLHPPPNDGRSKEWSREEQAGTKSASAETLENLTDANRKYEQRFGHIFIVCASGKSAAEMLALLDSRLHNDARTELAIAAEEQRKIMLLRLARLLEAEGA